MSEDGAGEAGTLRERIRHELSEREMTVRTLSQRLRASEREVRGALPHVARSVQAAGGRLVMTPPSCAGCGFLFEGRTRAGRPSRCPKCRSTHVLPPAFRVEGAAAAS